MDRQNASCRCGARLRGEATWCPQCYRPLDATAPDAPLRRAPVLSPETEQRMYREYRREQRRQRRRDGALFALLDLLRFWP